MIKKGRVEKNRIKNRIKKTGRRDSHEPITKWYMCINLTEYVQGKEGIE